MALSMQEKWDPKCTSDSTWINDWVIFRSLYLAKNRCIILCITRADRHLDPAVPNDKPTLGLNKLHKNTEVCKKQPKQNFIPILQYSTIGSWIFSVWTKKKYWDIFQFIFFCIPKKKEILAEFCRLTCFWRISWASDSNVSSKLKSNQLIPSSSLKLWPWKQVRSLPLDS